MPCACKKNKQLIKPTSIYKPSVSAYSRVVPRASLQNKMSRPVVYRHSDSSFDFTPTTKPTQECVYCAMKHLGYASALLDSGYSLDTLLASAQIWNAGAHYADYSQQASKYCQGLARYLVYNIDQPKAWKRKLQPIVQFAVELGTPPELFWDASMQEPWPVPQGTPRYTYAMMMLHTAVAFSLLYTQIGYQEINKAFAVGQLVAAAATPGYKLQVLGLRQGMRTDMPQEIRKVWKMIQQQTLNDSTYYKCRQKLTKIMQLQVDQYMRYYVLSSDSGAV